MSTTWKTTSLALILGALAVAASFHALQDDDPGIPAASLVRHSAVVDADTIALQEARIIAAAGRSAVARINAARGRLQTDDSAGARRLVIQAEAILEQIRNALHADAQQREADAGLRVPLWAQVDPVGESPVPAGLESRLQQTRNHAILGRHDEVIRDLRGTGVALVYSYIDLPLDRTLQWVRGARAAMEGGDASEALRLLDAATDDLESETLRIGTVDEMRDRAPDDA